ncbi:MULTISPECIES: PP2C family protein-serine/threonine phosphatase [unclassified Leptospira]|uniref:PP2C family protein-serine/threonine phosphatase n=1 Tax=unclassified Leptospira TaxID=2633828 RepID=UPI0002BF34E3|nr:MULTISPECIES: PP2C family protein-serine/threonine phosphatase [unclassified Leptospira]EMJ97828.1 stage II sporulation protein E [Leptospira sp. B5-022]MCR1795301.1 SpoIIE family protein phosphatase [Leptospira sp. id769339]
MEASILFSHHASGVFSLFLLTFVLSGFLVFKKNRTLPTYYLIIMYMGYGIMFLGYFLSYSIFHPVAAYHRYLTVFVIFGIVGFIGFCYNFPRNIHPKESKVVIPLSLVIALAAWIHFIVKTAGKEKIYLFSAHHYSFDFGKEASLAILLCFIISTVILIRKTIHFSHYSGIFHKWNTSADLLALPARILVKSFIFLPLYFMKLALPARKEGIALRAFLLTVTLNLLNAYNNILNKSGVLSYDTYAIAYFILSVITIFSIQSAYLNHSPEPTSFMGKILSSAVVTVVLALGAISYITLFSTDKSIEKEDLVEMNAVKTEIRNGHTNFPPNVRYVLSRPIGPGIFDHKYEILFSKDGLNQTILEEGEKYYKTQQLKEGVEKNKKIHKGKSESELETITLKEMKETDLPLSSRLFRVAGDFYIHYDFVIGQTRYEVGFAYVEFRQVIHDVARWLILIIFGTTIFILIAFPILLRVSLIHPLNNLLSGVEKVNHGDLNVNVPIKAMDEIGFLSLSFNSMVDSIRGAREQLQEHADHLEEKVEERTKEVQEKMEEVQRLKIQQDGDYFLTSLLAKPLFYNANKSSKVNTNFIIRQKKYFEFRNKQGELGGDICLTGNLRLGTPDNYRKFTMAMNGDAMGKSMQGAGGSLVMGVVMNSIMARSAANKRILAKTPEEWLAETYTEVHSVFKSFDGTMVISATVILIDDDTGEMYYWNAEHPFSVLYRDGKASFIENTLELRKLGLDSEFEFKVKKFQLHPGDLIILASDGRDDLLLSEHNNKRVINEDENVFLDVVERSQGDIKTIEKNIRSIGEVIDDLSILRIGFQEVNAPAIEQNEDRNDFADKVVLQSLYKEGKELYRNGEAQKAISILLDAYATDNNNQKLNKLLGLISFKEKDYPLAVKVLSKYLSQDPDTAELWYYLSIAEKRIGNLAQSLEAAMMVNQMQPMNVQNLVHLSDLNRLLGNREEAIGFTKTAEEIDPENKNIRKLKRLLDMES